MKCLLYLCSIKITTNHTIMKSILFKTAWAIFKMQTITFSDALKEAWKQTKAGFKTVITRLNKLVKSEKWIGFETVYYNALQTLSIEVKRNNNSNTGAGAWYDGKTFNND